MNISDLFTKVDKVTVSEAKKIIHDKGHEGVMLLDVREPSEYQEGHIPGAVFMPLSGLQDSSESLDMSKKIITYCRRGPRSRSAAALLKRKGMHDVSYMDGGTDAWNGLVASGPYESGLELLDGRESLEDLTLLAWSLEEGTGVFYTEIKELVDDEEARGLFDALIKAEKGHKSRLLESYRQLKGSDITEDEVAANSLKGYMEGGVSVNETVDWLKNNKSELRDILELSMQIETNSLDLYMKMVREVKDEVAKKVFDVLIDEEKTHLSRLGKLLDSKIKSNYQG